jgi:hypothetical protein
MFLTIIRQKLALIATICRRDPAITLGAALAVAALAGWSCFAYSASQSRDLGQRIEVLTADLDAATSKHHALRNTAGELARVEGKLSAARMEHSRAVQAGAEAKATTAEAQQELILVSKRLERARDRTLQTGSIRQTELVKRTARQQTSSGGL